MSDPEQSSEPLQDGAFKQKLLSTIELLRPGVRQLTDGQQAVIDVYEEAKQQLAGPSFGPVAPEITGYVRDDGKVRIYGRNLGEARSLRIAGRRVTRADFRFKDGEEPHIEADVPGAAAAGPITVFTSGGLATSRLPLGDSRKSERLGPAAGQRTKGTTSRRRPKDQGAG